MGQMTVDWLVGGLNFVAGCLCISGAIVNFQMMQFNLRTAYIAGVLVLSGLIFTIFELFPCPAFFQRQMSHLNTYQGRAIHYVLLGISAAQYPLVFREQDLEYQKYWMLGTAIALVLVGLLFGLLAIINGFLRSSKKKLIPRPRSMDVSRDTRANRRASRGMYSHHLGAPGQQKQQHDAPVEVLPSLMFRDNERYQSSRTRAHRSSTVKSAIDATTGKRLDGSMYSIDLTHIPTSPFSSSERPHTAPEQNSSSLHSHQTFAVLSPSFSPHSLNSNSTFSSPKGSASSITQTSSSPWSTGTKFSADRDYPAKTSSPRSGYSSAGMYCGAGESCPPLQSNAGNKSPNSPEGVFSAQQQQQQQHKRHNSGASFSRSSNGTKGGSKSTPIISSPLANNTSIPQTGNSSTPPTSSAGLSSNKAPSLWGGGGDRETRKANRRPGSSGSANTVTYVKAASSTDAQPWKPPHLQTGFKMGKDGYYRDLNADGGAGREKENTTGASHPEKNGEVMQLQQLADLKSSIEDTGIPKSPNSEILAARVMESAARKRRHSRRSVYIPSIGTIELSSESESGIEDLLSEYARDDSDDERTRLRRTSDRHGTEMKVEEDEVISDDASIYSIPSPAQKTQNFTSEGKGKLSSILSPSNSMSSLRNAAALTREEALKVGRKLSRSETQLRRGKIQRAISIRQQRLQQQQQQQAPVVTSNNS